MAGTKEIRTRIKSVQQTLKITSAMYLISSANLRKAKGQLDRAAPYFTKIDTTIADILYRSPELEHEFFDPRTDVPEQERKVGYIVVSGDKGLAGAYNHNVLRRAEEYVRRSPHPSLFVVGVVGRLYFRAGASPSWRSSPMWCRIPPCGGHGRSATRWYGGSWTVVWMRCAFCILRWSLP